ncbi:unnamed protein product [Pedinophyceae sp. YPF-701]|nr:unnamed protein product [Pedinophyceae sp. YPF-701]
MLNQLGKIGTGTAVGAVTALLGLQWRNPLNVLIGIGAMVPGPQAGALTTAGAVLSGIHLLSLDPKVEEFPSQTFGPGAAIGSCRVTVENPKNAGELRPVTVQGSLDEVTAKVEDWIKGDAMGRTALLRKEENVQGASGKPANYLHSRHVSLVFSFADDVFIRITDQGGNKCLVEYQGQLRFGGGDLGVNAARAKRMYDAISA